MYQPGLAPLLAAARSSVPELVRELAGSVELRPVGLALERSDPDQVLHVHLKCFTFI